MIANLRLLVADDHDVVRKGVRTLLEEQPGWEVAHPRLPNEERIVKTTRDAVSWPAHVGNFL